MNMDQTAINAIRVLSAESIQKAKSGHPGLPLGCAAAAYELWANHMHHDPACPDWDNRDRFVLSAGHGSMLLYSLLHLFGYGLTLEDLKSFRQWGSLTPGHPEYRHTKGVESTSGPLGQGIATAVGMAMAEAHLEALFNQDGYPVVDHYTYVLLGDGCMMEGVQAEAASLAGTLKLGKLIALYDSNNITIEGDTATAFGENVAQRYEAYGWQVQQVADGNDRAALSAAIEAAKAESGKPSLIVMKTKIGYGSPLEGSAKTHGEPLGEENIAKMKENIGWEGKGAFEVPAALYEYMAQVQQRLTVRRKEWEELYGRYEKAYPELAAKYQDFMSGKLPDLAEESLWHFEGKAATRATSGEMLNRLAKVVPNFFGGSADLAPSNKSDVKGADWFGPQNYAGQNIHFGVREFAMAAACNGIALHGGLRPYCATFFVFSDYLKGAIRLSALMKLPVLYILTHDSIGVGEDGPTHQPIEHLAALRATPGVHVFRPADGKETAAGYVSALNYQGPTCMIATRQNLPTYENSGKAALKGGYILQDCEGTPDLILMASGSEVEQAMGAAELLKQEGIHSRVVSMPCMELFEEQEEAYKESVLPKAVRARVAVEAGCAMPWNKYVGLDGAIVAIDHFGASAPAGILFEQFGFTVQNVADQAKKVLGK